ncbi:MAG: hypothetical protein ACXW6K_23215 [Candidatus Binatia bacterium]
MVTALPSLSAQGKKQCHDRAGVAGVYITGGLVGEDPRRIVIQRQRHGDALLFAAGQFVYALWPIADRVRKLLHG